MKKWLNILFEPPEKNARFSWKHLPFLLKETYFSWIDKDPFKLSAVTAYYAILSLPAFLIMVLNLVGSVWEKDLVHGKLFGEIASALGPDTAMAIQNMIANKGNENTSLTTTILGVGILLYGATGVFYQLQNSLNEIWNSKTNYANGIIAMFIGRVKGLGFILILGFLLLISFILTSLLSVFSEQFSALFSIVDLRWAMVVDFLFSFVFISLLFAAMFKYLPSTVVPWKAVRRGAILTAILFLIGKYVLAFYFSEAEPSSTYGTAGSVILVMLWVSYSSLIVFFGANFTKVFQDKYLTDPSLDQSNAKPLPPL